ncbi:MFS transporter [Streptomyces kaniharaensis]|uniref:MFS transporter n=1 Tax=Streptomyces kaniharaensis TaxID=212423 RepID=A0A6N7KZB8_9ACTN|nr:MFS transporter [Streptomyces kaniharaensis]MQS16992.1 MFS transporter [Streptomyces kaniharaensis]
MATETGAAARPTRQAWTLVLASLGVFMTALDTLVVTTALPVLRVSLHGGLTDLEWTVNAYNLCFACSLLTGAALGDRFGRRRMYGVGLAVFTAASAAAALSPTVGALVAARAVQGAGAALVMPLTLTLISEAFPAGKRGMAIGLWGGIAGLAVAAGPVVGGAVVQGISWHWIFWLNVPIGLALIPLALTRLRESFGPRPHLDVPGLLLAGAGFFGITWGLVRANTVGWGSAEVVGSLIAGAALVGAFLWWERRAPAPMLPLTMFRRRGFSAANGVSFFLYAGLFGALFLMAQFFQTAQGLTPMQAGLRLLAWTAAPMVVAPLAGRLADRYGNRPFIVGGLLLQACGLAWVAAIAQPGLGFAELGIALAVAGIGTSLVFPTVANEVVASVDGEDVGMAAGTNSAMRELGGVFGVAVLASVFARPGAYATPGVFVDGFTSALWVGVGLSAVGVLVGLAGPRRTTPAQDVTARRGSPRARVPVRPYSASR